MPYTYEYPRPALTADTVLVALDRGRPRVLLVRRKHDPFAGCWALPGGFVEIDERLQPAARRELQEETCLRADRCTLLGTYDAVDRDPRGRTLSVVFLAALTGPPPQPTAGDDAEDAAWFSLLRPPELAFDHRDVLRDARARLRELARDPRALLREVLPRDADFEDVWAFGRAVLGDAVCRRALRRQLGCGRNR